MPDFDHYWHGSPAAMTSALTSIGWAPEGTQAAVAMPAYILGIVPPVLGSYGGESTWTALIRSTTPLAFPEGITPVPADMNPDPRVALGVIASLSPRVITASAFYSRFTQAERIAMRAVPEFNDAEVFALAQGKVNLDSEEIDRLFEAAVTLGVLTNERAAQILA
jgi:hypothetical protein